MRQRGSIRRRPVADSRRPEDQREPRAVENFETANRILGNLVGETFGYLFTATWTLAVAVALHRRYAGAWFTGLGITSAVPILAGVLSPLDLPAVDLANFVGYVAWSGWLLVLAVLLLIRRSTATGRPVARLGNRVRT